MHQPTLHCLIIITVTKTKDMQITLQQQHNAAPTLTAWFTAQQYTEYQHAISHSDHIYKTQNPKTSINVLYAITVMVEQFLPLPFGNQYGRRRMRTCRSCLTLPIALWRWPIKSSLHAYNIAYATLRLIDQAQHSQDYSVKYLCAFLHRQRGLISCSDSGSKVQISRILADPPVFRGNKE